MDGCTLGKEPGMTSAAPPPNDPDDPDEPAYGVPWAYPMPPPQPAYPYYAAPPGSPYGVPVVRGINGFAVAGLIFSFFCTILGLVFSVIALVQIRRTGQAGKGLAIAGLVISLVFIALIAGLWYVLYLATYHSG
jgi:hypothetical protein